MESCQLIAVETRLSHRREAEPAWHYPDNWLARPCGGGNRGRTRGKASRGSECRNCGSGRGRAERCGVAERRAHHPVPAARSQGRGGAELQDGSARRVRRNGALHRASRRSTRSRTGSSASGHGATRILRPTGSASSSTRFTTAGRRYEFAVNPAGVKQDSYWYNDTNNDQGWDAVWDVAVSRNERGWRAEFRIPFSQLRYRPADAATFGLAIVRRDRTAERNVDVAAAGEERERLRLVVRRARPACD